MRRTLLALTALASLAILASGGSGALAISTGPLGASPDPVAFGTQAQGVTATRTVTISDDSGTVPITISSISASGDYGKTNDTCTGTTLNSTGDQCTVGVTFKPTSSGSDPGTLTINDDDSADGSQQTVNLTGSGVANQFTVTTPPDFGDIVVGHTSADQGVTVTNATDYDANPSGPTIGGADAADFGISANTCGGVVPANTSCTFNIHFSPSGTGAEHATLNVGGQALALSGTGTQANAQVTPASIAFGNQPIATDSGPSTITLKNTGTAQLTYSSTSVGGSNPTDFSVSDAGCVSAVLNPGDQCTISADFVPTASGSRSATVTVHDSDPNNPTQTLTLTGNGTASSVAFTPSSVTFTNPVVAGLASPAHTVRITNATSKNMPISGVTLAGANPKNFLRSADTCTGQTLAPNTFCTVHVQFAPTGAGRRTALLQVTDTGPVGPAHKHVLTLTGTGKSPNNPKSVHGTVGCQSTRITWVSPTATRFAGVRVVRNHAHFPANAGDGTLLRHAGGVAVDTHLKHFTTYYYRVFAAYHSRTRPSRTNYSAGVKLKLRTGEICTPQARARISDRTPKFSWLAASTRSGYAFVLQRGDTTIKIGYARKTSYQLPSSWHYHGGRHLLVEGGTYTFFLYAYPKAHPNGVLIGQVTFFER